MDYSIRLLFLVGLVTPSQSGVLATDYNDQGSSAQKLSGILYHNNEHSRSFFDSDSAPAVLLDLRLTIDDSTFNLTVQKRIHNDYVIGIRHGTDINDVIMLPPNNNPDAACFSAGYVTSHEGVAAFHHCGKQITGMMMTNSNQYDITVSKLNWRIRRSTDNGVHVHIVRTARDTAGEEEVQLLHVVEDAVEESSNKHERERRAPRPVDVEIAVYLDSFYNAYLEEAGLSTVEEKMSAIMLKYLGADALYNLKDQLVVKVNLIVKYIEIWIDENPEWYVLDGHLDKTRKAFCANVHSISHTRFDAYGLHTRQPQKSHVKGVATVGTVCGDLSCYVETTSMRAPLLVAHEIGHLLGMVHDHSKKCKEYGIESGIVEEKYILRWNECNRAKLNETIGKKLCLRETNVNLSELRNTSTRLYMNGHHTDKLLPGQKFTLDQICERVAGKGAWYYDPISPYGRTMCKSTLTCAKRVRDATVGDASVIYEGTTSYIIGKYCNGDNKICFNYNGTKPLCNSVDLTGANNTIIEGQWSDFGPWTECTRTCGTGVRYRRRDCNNPVPQNARYCKGPQYELLVCNTKACDGNAVSKRETIEQSRIQTCELMNDSIDLESRSSQCKVKCKGHEMLVLQGTPCYGRKHSYCVDGLCRKFTMEWVEGNYTARSGGGKRTVITTIPAQSKNISFEFDRREMSMYNLEIWTKHDEPVLTPVAMGIWNTMDNPINFAGTYWYFRSGQQFLQAESVLALTEPAVIKIHKRQKLKNQINTGIHFSYVRPISGTCKVDKTLCRKKDWDSKLCTCTCTEGLYGQDCSSKCKTYCFNGNPVGDDCKCACNKNTFPPYCLCRSAFTGKDCKTCEIDKYTYKDGCKKECKKGCGNLDCNVQCSDARGSKRYCKKIKDPGTTCLEKKAERRCQKTCKYCVPSDTKVNCP